MSLNQEWISNFIQLKIIQKQKVYTEMIWKQSLNGVRTFRMN